MNKPPLIIAGQFPPPVNGFAYITQEMARTLAASHEVTIIDLAPHVPKNGLPYHLRRLALTLKGLVPLVRGHHQPNRHFYIACEGKLGLIYTLILCAAARALRYPTSIHYHNFSFIDRFSFLMAMLLRVLGQRATHIFLAPVMAERFTARYNIKPKSIILSNSAFVPLRQGEPRPWRPEEPLTLGLLSNLNDEKGLSLFIETLRLAKRQGLAIRAVLAGPPVSAKDREAIEAAQQEFGPQLDYRGPLYGTAKDDFFRAIDVFVLPTCYANEAQPTVIFEAMASGAPILAYDRGCIRDQVGTCGAVLSQGEDFPSFAVNWLSTQIAAPERLNQLKLDARAAFLDDRMNAQHKTSWINDNGISELCR